MKKEEFLKLYKSYGKIEEMPAAELEKVIQAAMDLEMEPIRAISYMGGIRQLVEYQYPELIARCPMTYLKDTYNITIQYVPDKKIPELKSLKRFLDDFIDVPISHEHLQGKIAKEFVDAIEPHELILTIDVTVRGGIYTTLKYVYEKKEEEECKEKEH